MIVGLRKKWYVRDRKTLNYFSFFNLANFRRKVESWNGNSLHRCLK